MGRVQLTDLCSTQTDAPTASQPQAHRAQDRCRGWQCQCRAEDRCQEAPQDICIGDISESARFRKRHRCGDAGPGSIELAGHAGHCTNYDEVCIGTS